MTFWTTLWYAGSVVITMGYEGQTQGECVKLGEVMMADINAAYANPDVKSKIVETGPFDTNQFKVTCETELLPIDEKFMK